MQPVQEPADPNRVWRVFYTTARAEKKCEARLLERDIEVFLPKVTVLRQWKDRRKKIIEPLFKNYLFARVDEPTRLRVLQTQGIVRTVAFGGRLAEVTDQEIGYLKISQSAREQLSVHDVWRPAVGAQVTVIEGPLAGLQGEVLEHRGQTYLLIRIEAIRQAVKVHLSARWVETASAA